MQDHDLIDVAPENRRYTWNNHRLGKENIMERLDRFLVNISFLSSFSTAYSVILPYAASDHYPTTLTLETHSSLGPIPFKYSLLWNNLPIVDQLVNQTWRQHIEGSPRFIWESKLKRIKSASKDWARNHYKEPEKVKIEIKRDRKSVV